MIETKVKPEIKLKRLYNEVVNTETPNEFNELMRICEVAGFQWGFGKLPTKENEERWNKYKEDTCVNILISHPLLYYSPKSFYEKKSDVQKKVISMGQFLKMNNLDSGKLNEINNYFAK